MLRTNGKYCKDIRRYAATSEMATSYQRIPTSSNNSLAGAGGTYFRFVPKIESAQAAGRTKKVLIVHERVPGSHRPALYPHHIIYFAGLGCCIPATPS